MTYSVIRGEKEDLLSAPAAPIANVLWGTTYAPETSFRALYSEKNASFYFLLTCREKNPRITYTQPGGEVCEDSCMEVFLNFAPEKTRDYINFEMNAAGAYLFGVGPDRYERRDLTARVMPRVFPKIEEDRWSVLLQIPVETIEEVFGPIDCKAGFTFTGNAFKCGDLTESEHYLSWAPMQEDAMDFHRSDRFGTFVIA